MYRTRAGLGRQWRYSDEERPPGTFAGCFDCRLPYGMMSDCVLSDELWEQINPTEHRGSGLLCANCIGERLNWLGIHGAQVTLW